MNLTLSLAWRNVWRHKRRTWLTTGAMTLCNVVLIFMMSLQAGSYLSMINNTLSMFSGHLQVQHPQYLNDPKPRHAIKNAIDIADTLRKQDINASTRGVSFALISSETRAKPMQVIGVEEQFEATVSNIPGTLRKGDYLTPDNPYGVVISALAATLLHADIGSELTLLGSGQDDSFAASILTVTGIYDSGMSDFDRNMIFIRLEDFQDIFSFGNSASHVVITSESFFDVESLARRVDALIGKDQSLAVVEWNDLVPGLKQAIQSDMMSALFIYLVLIIVVVFSVLNNQLMAVLERQREYGILIALGVRPNKLLFLLLMETTILVMLGLIIGVTLGTAIVEYTANVGIAFEGMEEMNAKFNLPARIFPALHPLVILAGPLLVALGSILATLYPAFKLQRLSPLASRYKA